MKTITAFDLERLLQEHRVELIDVRPAGEFKRVHLSGARSIPLREFEPHLVMAHRKHPSFTPLCLMCDRQMLASMAAGKMAGAGFPSPIVLRRGLEGWREQGLPVVQRSDSQPLVLTVAHFIDCFRSALAHLWQRLQLRPA